MSSPMSNAMTVSDGDGDGVDVKPLFPLPDFNELYPTVLSDHFNIGAGRGFSDHSYRGFEASQ
ncbi:MAG TPA: hypothetical protein ENJ08_11865 [Gammaproteobacteria bacterium]|nr:hypothetical protein [Gammaproteobacteria bacterium]